MEMEDFPTTLVSTASIQNLQKNIDAVNAKLTDEEGSCLQFIRNKYVCWVFWALNNFFFFFFDHSHHYPTDHYIPFQYFQAKWQSFMGRC